ncbi:hypothetical protein [Campylobacter hyointestinalis]|uniref:hypothetical protein n=1 Tax=Campylobacter hyointestinalis TaxID=198 RepID=UPI00072957C9|nr:hypothetical protein [Campylobacter hyointestinalis]CUU80528.1 Uncharacterised protein [Campylobacter hyointestinalis subsp. hyointestinalis]
MAYTEASGVTVRPHIISDAIKKELLTKSATVEISEPIISGTLLFTSNGKDYKVCKPHTSGTFKSGEYVIKQGQICKALKETSAAPSGSTDENWEIIKNTLLGVFNELEASVSGNYSVLVCGVVKTTCDDETKFAALKQNLIIL